MDIRLLKLQDTVKLEEYLAPHRAECMFICNNLKAAGIEYQGAYLQGEYFGYFHDAHSPSERLLGIIVHYWNCNVIIHASGKEISQQLVIYLKDHIVRPIGGVLGPDAQVEYAIKNLGLPNNNFSINRNESLFEINLAAISELKIPGNLSIIKAQDVSKTLLINWMLDYNIEALGGLAGDKLEKQVSEDLGKRLEKNDSYVMLSNDIPVSFSAFNARSGDMVQVGPVWTPIEHRNKGFAKLLLTHILHQEKKNGTKQAVLFTNNPVAIKVYLNIGFKKIGTYRLALLQKS